VSYRRRVTVHCDHVMADGIQCVQRVSGDTLEQARHAAERLGWEVRIPDDRTPARRDSRLDLCKIHRG